MTEKIKALLDSLWKQLNISDLQKKIPGLGDLNLDSVKGGVASAGPQGPRRPMKFPYTFSAKIAQFPWRYYMEKNWVAKYYPLAVLLSLPIFLKVHRMSNTKNNKRVWAEIRAKEANPHAQDHEPACEGEEDCEKCKSH